nr:MAG TPA: hypothetical protein [Herelleviridae sp.]
MVILKNETVGKSRGLFLCLQGSKHYNKRLV